MQTGIPEEAFDLECPDLLLKTSVLQEFILIDGRYVEKLTELEREHYMVLKYVACDCFTVTLPSSSSSRLLSGFNVQSFSFIDVRIIPWAGASELAV